VRTLITHHPVGPSPDDDPTGVRALLASLPEPDPIPAYLIERINVSLAAEQAQRAATSPARSSGASVTPLLTAARRRPGRFLFGLAGVAAAVALVGVVGNGLLTDQSSVETNSAGAAISSADQEGRAGATLGTDQGAGGSSTDKGGKDTAGGGAPYLASSPVISFEQSGTRYTQADFVTQVQTMSRVAPDTSPNSVTGSATAGPIGTTAGLTSCLGQIGAGSAQLVRADLASYDGQPAVIIVATTDGIPTAYVVGRGCSGTDAALLRPATPLP